MQNLVENVHTLTEEEASLVPKAFPLIGWGHPFFKRKSPGDEVGRKPLGVDGVDILRNGGIHFAPP